MARSLTCAAVTDRFLSAAHSRAQEALLLADARVGLVPGEGAQVAGTGVGTAVGKEAYSKFRDRSNYVVDHNPAVYFLAE